MKLYYQYQNICLFIILDHILVKRISCHRKCYHFLLQISSHLILKCFFDLYTSCKHFFWLRFYRFGLLRETEYDVIYSTVDINGKNDGPEYRFNTYDSNPSGFLFYRLGKVIGNSCYIKMLASNLMVYAINGCKYNPRDEKGNVCDSIYDAELAKVYDKLHKIDGKTLQFIQHNRNKNQDFCLITYIDCINNKFLLDGKNIIQIQVERILEDRVR